MNKLSTSPYLALIALIIALALWSGVGYFVWTVSLAAKAHRAEIAGMEQQTAEHATALRLHALARETKEERLRLDELSHSDLAEILDTIEALARDAGVPIEVPQAPSIVVHESSPFRTASVSIDAQGTFPQVARVVALLETMPIPSALEEVRLERVQGNDRAIRNAWHIIARVQFLTTANIPAL